MGDQHHGKRMEAEIVRAARQAEQAAKKDGVPPPKPKSDRPAEQHKSTTAGHLQHDDNFHRSKGAKSSNFDDTPDMDDVMSAADVVDGENVAQILPSSRAFGHPDLPEVETRPPEFLSPLEAMKDIYMKTRGRMSRRTKELLEGVDLEDLLDMLRALFADDVRSKSGEAHLIHPIRDLLKDDPGPLLLGLTDIRLTEPWRLFLDDWEIWVPDGEEDGVDLFWEGEAENDDGDVIVMLQSLQFRNGEISLFAKLGEVEDRVSFDGETFYRLKADREDPDDS